MYKLNTKQKIIYHDIFNPFSRKQLNFSHEKSLEQLSNNLFGHNLLDRLIKEKETCYFYLTRIIFHIKYVTHITDNNWEIFREFYEKVANFCLEVIKKFYPDNDKEPIYTEDFCRLLIETIISSLNPHEGDKQRMKDIFFMEMIISFSSEYLEYLNGKRTIPEMLKKQDDGITHQIAQWQDQIQKIIANNSIHLEKKLSSDINLLQKQAYQFHYSFKKKVIPINILYGNIAYLLVLLLIVYALYDRYNKNSLFVVFAGFIVGSSGYILKCQDKNIKEKRIIVDNIISNYTDQSRHAKTMHTMTYEEEKIEATQLEASKEENVEKIIFRFQCPSLIEQGKTESHIDGINHIYDLPKKPMRKFYKIQDESTTSSFVSVIRSIDSVENCLKNDFDLPSNIVVRPVENSKNHFVIYDITPNVYSSDWIVSLLEKPKIVSESNKQGIKRFGSCKTENGQSTVNIYELKNFRRDSGRERLLIAEKKYKDKVIFDFRPEFSLFLSNKNNFELSHHQVTKEGKIVHNNAVSKQCRR